MNTKRSSLHPLFARVWGAVKCSGLHALAALACGAMLGIAAVIAIGVIVDAAPEQFARPLGIVFSVLVAGVVLSSVARLLAALLSPARRTSIAAHEVVHAVWFGAAGIIAILAFLFQDRMRSFLSSPNRWVVIWSQQPRCEGRTMEQWLRTLSLEPGRSGSPLESIQVRLDTNLRTTFLEVPLSYDLMREHNFLRGVGHIFPVIDGGAQGVECARGTNGSVLIPLSWDYAQILPGLHQVEVEFEIWPRPFTRLRARGPARALAYDYPIISH